MFECKYSYTAFSEIGQGLSRNLILCQFRYLIRALALLKTVESALVPEQSLM